MCDCKKKRKRKTTVQRKRTFRQSAPLSFSQPNARVVDYTTPVMTSSSRPTIAISPPAQQFEPSVVSSAALNSNIPAINRTRDSIQKEYKHQTRPHRMTKILAEKIEVDSKRGNYEPTPIRSDLFTPTKVIAKTASPLTSLRTQLLL